MTQNGWRRNVVIACVFLVSLLLVSVAGAGADGEDPVDPVDIVPLRHLLEMVHHVYPGRILEVELEQEEDLGAGVWIYEVKMLTRRGRVYELKYDAQTLELLDAEGIPDCMKSLKGENAHEGACRRR